MSTKCIPVPRETCELIVECLEGLSDPKTITRLAYYAAGGIAAELRKVMGSTRPVGREEQAVEDTSRLNHIEEKVREHLEVVQPKAKRIMRPRAHSEMIRTCILEAEADKGNVTAESVVEKLDRMGVEITVPEVKVQRAVMLSAGFDFPEVPFWYRNPEAACAFSAMVVSESPAQECRKIAEETGLPWQIVSKMERLWPKTWAAFKSALPGAPRMRILRESFHVMAHDGNGNGTTIGERLTARAMSVN